MPTTSASLARRVAALVPAVAVLIVSGLSLSGAARQRPTGIPAVYSGIHEDADGRMVFQAEGGQPFVERDRPPAWTLDQLRGSPRGTARGLALDFGKRGFSGSLVFGLIPGDTRYPQPVFRSTVPIKDGQAEIDIAGRLAGAYDMVGWQKTGSGLIGFRVIGPDGAMLHDGRVRFKGTGPFEADVTLVEGPMVANVTATSAVVWFELDRPAPASVTVGRRTFSGTDGSTHKELLVDHLVPGTRYRYTVRYGDHTETGAFRTSPAPGTRGPFVFGYASDSRAGQGGGDRNFNGPNAYIMRRLMALAASRGTAFVQFTGDLVSGSVTSPDALMLELANWKRAVEAWGRWLPIYTGVGNHEAVLRELVGASGRQVRIPRFPFETDSTEAVFARALVNPTNGPASEDGASYDPDPTATDFPTYRENVYSYTYDNVAVVVLNSDYWFTPTIEQTPQTGGNLHAYLMDNQMAWLAGRLRAFERDRSIDHVFLTVHTPVFPNGGHVGDDMWYGGRNGPRPRVAGQPVGKGIIERRDDLLALIQKHPKVLAVLTGDEHNYNRLRLGPGVSIYPEGWDKARVRLARSFYQINNGAAGAPYYAQDRTPPWSSHLKGFSTQNALCLFRVDGPRVRLEVVNPDTLEVIDRAILR